jgi:hypothetical protein
MADDTSDWSFESAMDRIMEMARDELLAKANLDIGDIAYAPEFDVHVKIMEINPGPLGTVMYHTHRVGQEDMYDLPEEDLVLIKKGKRNIVKKNFTFEF